MQPTRNHQRLGLMRVEILTAFLDYMYGNDTGHVADNPCWQSTSATHWGSQMDYVELSESLLAIGRLKKASCAISFRGEACNWLEPRHQDVRALWNNLCSRRKGQTRLVHSKSDDHLAVGHDLEISMVESNSSACYWRQMCNRLPKCLLNSALVNGLNL